MDSWNWVSFWVGAIGVPAFLVWLGVMWAAFDDFRFVRSNRRGHDG